MALNLDVVLGDAACVLGREPRQCLTALAGNDQTIGWNRGLRGSRRLGVTRRLGLATAIDRDKHERLVLCSVQVSHQQGVALACTQTGFIRAIQRLRPPTEYDLLDILGMPADLSARAGRDLGRICPEIDKGALATYRRRSAPHRRGTPAGCALTANRSRAASNGRWAATGDGLAAHWRWPAAHGRWTPNLRHRRDGSRGNDAERDPRRISRAGCAACRIGNGLYRVGAS